MKYLIQTILLLILTLVVNTGYAQMQGFNYQAVILNPQTHTIPGNDISVSVLSNSEISIRFTITVNQLVEYQEMHLVSTDKYGMVSLTVGQGYVISGNFNSIVWDGLGKSLLVDIDFSATGDEYELLDTHMLTYTPHPMTNEELERIEGIELNVENNMLAIIAEQGRALDAEAAIQADVDLNKIDSDAADTAIQNDVDQNEADSDATDTAIQSDVDQNETDSDAADSAIQSDVDQNELNSDAADSDIQDDVDQNESDSDAADSDIQDDVDQNESDASDAVLAEETRAINAETINAQGVANNSISIALNDSTIGVNTLDIMLNASAIQAHIDADQDLNSMNEIQDLSLNGNSLSITNNDSASTVDLSSYLDDTTLTFEDVEGMGFVAVTGSEIAIGPNAGLSNQGSNSIAIGEDSGMTGQSNQSVAIGHYSGRTNQSDQSVAIGLYSGYDSQGSKSIAIGPNAGMTNQGVRSIAIGYGAGQVNQHDRTIVLNASNANELNTDQSNSFYVSPIRLFGMWAPATRILIYNPESHEITQLSAPASGNYKLVSQGGSINWVLDN